MINIASTRRAAAAVLASAALVTGATGVTGVTPATAQPAPAETSGDTKQAAATRFELLRSSGAVNAGCLQGAGADVTVKELGGVEQMTVKVHGLPAGKTFNLFVTQDSEAPFGVSWYQGDLRTDQSGNGKVVARGRFNVETFAVAPGVTDAPNPHDEEPFPDAEENPAFAPVHTYHLGLWFESPDDADDAGCPDTVTPFNGEHDAGIQALSSRNFPQLAGPLSRIG